MKKEYGPEKWPELAEIAEIYNDAMREEIMSYNRSWQLIDAEEMYGTAIQVMMSAKLGVIPRSANGRYNNYHYKYTPFSVGAHTNLAADILLKQLKYMYGPDEVYTEFGHSYTILIEIILRHDLPETETGDTPAVKERDERLKVKTEEDFQIRYSNLSPRRERSHEKSVREGLYEMEFRKYNFGKGLFATDKSSAIIEALINKKLGMPYLLKPTEPGVSMQDLEEMAVCYQHTIDGACFADEMWSVNYFRDGLVNDDPNGFCTSLMVMCTLLVDKRWHNWREKDYRRAAKEKAARRRK